MPSPRPGEEELEHAGAVCGWFSAEWAREAHPGFRRHRIEQPFPDVLTFIDESSHDAFEALSDYVLAGAWHRRAVGAGAEASWYRLVHSQTKAEEVVRAFASSVSNIEGVERVLFVEAADKVRVWTIMDEPERDTEDRIYAAEAETLKDNPDLLFDFRILFRQGKPLIPPGEAKDAR